MSSPLQELDFSESKLVFENQTGDSEGRVVVTTRLSADGIAWVEVRGRGSLEGMRAAGAAFEESFSCLDDRKLVRVGVDLAGFEGAPLVAQLSLVEWMIRFQSRIAFVGVAGGDTAALKVARAIQSLLPFGRRIGFFEDGSSLYRFLREHLDTPDLAA